MSVSPFQNLDMLLDAFARYGAVRILCKPLAENDNRKQQIYLGGNFDVLKLLPHQEIVSCPGGKRPNFKAPISLAWLDASMQAPEDAQGAQLILYPDYPEVRLSGFLRGCRRAPSEHMQPVPAGERLHAGENDGRVLFLAVNDNKTFAYLAETGSGVANELLEMVAAGRLEREGVFFITGPTAPAASRLELLHALRPICGVTWHPAQRRLSDGTIRMPYIARNAGGYTLESLLNITPNGTAEPDFLGWELKAYGSDRITLMTPEPDGGFYGEQGVREFVTRYGRESSPGMSYYTGLHRVGVPSNTSRQTLRLSGFDEIEGKITAVDGGIELFDEQGRLSARWSFAQLLDHWGRKHAFAAYIPYFSEGSPPSAYQFQREIFLGEGTEFALLLKSLAEGVVVFDPASKITVGAGGRSTVKARNQFRVSARRLAALYARFGAVTV